ncbi:MAG: 50S ribosomal protein L10 [Anaerolineales bacterium]|nr:50S ribosomal protein L10 [Anaerolineales bacterium]
MAITRERKDELVKTYTDLIQKSQGLILIEYRGINMKGMDPLRRKVREASGELHVVKNTLALRALQQAGYPAADALFSQTTAVAFAFGDPPAVAKALTAAAKDSEFVKVKGALLGNSVLSAKDVEALAALPPMPALRGQLLGLISTPASRLVGVVASGVRQVVNVVKAYADKESAEAPAAA